MEELTSLKGYEDFKQFVKNEIVKAIDEEDCEKMKFMLSTLELLFQMKMKLTSGATGVEKVKKPTVKVEKKEKKVAKPTAKSKKGVEKKQ